jgi:nicotinamidase-related amidase
MNALLVVDMQRDLFRDADARHDAQGVVSRIETLCRAMRATGGTVVFVRHAGADGWLEPGTEGWEILPELPLSEPDLLVEKISCDSFCRSPLEAMLRERGVEHLYVVGCCTDYCIDATVRAAASLGFRLTVPSDCHTTGDKPELDAATVVRHHNRVWATMITPEEPVRVMPLADCLKELGNG